MPLSTPWVPHPPRNVLGTVSQSGGDPTGAIIERGSNASGTYARFADGTQICQIAEPLAVDTSTVTGSLFRDTTIPIWTYPASFVSTFQVNVFCDIDGENFWASSSLITAVDAKVIIWSAGSIATNITIRRTAIGRWF